MNRVSELPCNYWRFMTGINKRVLTEDCNRLSSGLDQGKLEYYIMLYAEWKQFEGYRLHLLINEMNGSEKHLLTVKRGCNVCDRCVPCKKLTKYRAVYKLKLISFKQGTVLCIRSTWWQFLLFYIWGFKLKRFA